MKEMKSNPLVELRRQMQELSEGACDIGSGSHGIGASVVPHSEVGVYVVFYPKCYNDTETFPENIPEYKVKVQGYHQSSGKLIEPGELEELLQSNEGDTAAILKMLKELAGKEFKVSRDECVEAFGQMMDESVQGMEKGSETGEVEHVTENVGMMQQF